MTRAYFAVGGLSASLAYALLNFGGVRPADWNVSLLVIGIVGVTAWARPSRSNGHALPRELVLPSVGLLLLLCLQVIPLPPSVVALLSPYRGDATSALIAAGVDPGWVTLSAAPARTVKYVFRIMGYVVVVAVIRDAAWRLRARPWLVCFPLLLLGCAEAGAGLFGQGEALSPVSGTFVNPNHFAGFVEVCVPFALMYASAKCDRRTVMWLIHVLVGVAAAAVMYLGIGASASRAGLVISTGVAYLLLVFVLWYGPGEWRGRWRPLAPVAVGVVALSGLGAFLALASPALLDEIARSPELLSTIAVDSRRDLWAAALDVFTAYPVLGCGAGAFQSAVAAFKTASPTLDYDYAHNDYLQFLAETGIVGAALGVGVLAGLIRSGIKQVRSSQDRDQVAISLACLAALVAIALHSAVDFNLHIPATGLASAWIVGVSLRPEAPAHPLSRMRVMPWPKAL